MKITNRYVQWWATGLIVVGAVLLIVVFVSAFVIVNDPGTYYDEWVPAEGPEGPEASFDWASSDLVVEFVDTSSTGGADLERWIWDFGDGAESTDPSPSHQFGEDGEFTVTLEVADENGLASQAAATVGVEIGAENSGNGVLGLNDLADSVIEAVERAAKGGGVVLLVIGLFVVLTMIGGRLLHQGVRTLRPIPDRISVKVRPKRLELAMTQPEDEASGTAKTPVPPPSQSCGSAPNGASDHPKSGA